MNSPGNHHRVVAAATALACLLPPSAVKAEGSPSPIPIGEIAGSTEGKATFRLGLSWRDTFNKDRDYVIAPSIDVATADGRANLVTAGRGGVSDANINVGLSFSLIRKHTDQSLRSMAISNKAVTKATEAELDACLETCSPDVEDRHKDFCKKFAPDPLRDKVMDELKAWQDRLGESAWKVQAKQDTKLDAAQARSGAEVLQRALDIHESTKYNDSMRVHRGAGADTGPVESLRTSLADFADAKPSAAAPSVDAQVKGAAAAVQLLSDIYRRPKQSPEVTSEQLCSFGRENTEQATAAIEYPAWWVEPRHVSFAVRGGASRGDYYAVESGQDNLTKTPGKYGSFLLAMSGGMLLVPKAGAAGKKATGVLEGVLGYEYQMNPAKGSIEWCTQPGNVALDGGKVTTAESCTRGVFGAPVPTNRFSLGGFAGFVFSRSGAFKAQIGATWSIYRRGVEPRGNELTVLVPVFSLNAGGKEFEKQKFRGVIRIAPTIRSRWQKEKETDPTAYAVVTFMLTVQLLGQRSFWGDALSWW